MPRVASVFPVHLVVGRVACGRLVFIFLVLPPSILSLGVTMLAMRDLFVSGIWGAFFYVETILTWAGNMRMEAQTTVSSFSRRKHFIRPYHITGLAPPPQRRVGGTVRVY